MLHEITAKFYTFLEGVNSIYQHPLHYTYILHKTDGYLHLYDQATMDVVGRTKVIVLDQMKLFAFTNDFNLFYGLRENKFLIFQLSSSQWLAHIPIESGQQHKPYLEAYYLCYYSRKQVLICVTRTNFYLVNPGVGAAFKILPQLKHFQTPIFPQKVAQISVLMWIVGFQNIIYLVNFSQNFDSYEICDKITVGNIVSLSSQHNPKKQFVYLINDQNEVYLIKVYQKQKKIEVSYTFNHQQYIPNYLTLLRPGINTSTTDKLRNRLYLAIYCQQKTNENDKYFQQSQMIIDQNMENVNKQKKFLLFIVPTEVEYLTEQAVNTSSQISQQFRLKVKEQTFVIREMPQLKTSPWINIFTQNCLLFLTTANEVCCLDFSLIKELQLRADQWICMGYKFQQLEKNEVYEERQDEFEDQIEKEQKQITKQFLDDWSQSNLPKNVILGKMYNRIRSLDL